MIQNDKANIGIVKTNAKSKCFVNESKIPRHVIAIKEKSN